MKNLNQLLAVGGLALAVMFASGKAMAQDPGAGGFGGGGGYGGAGGGGFDINQMVQTQVTAMRDTLAVTNDDEWAVISPKLLKVMQLQTEDRMAGLGALGRGMGAGAAGAAGGGRNRGGAALLAALGISSDPDEEALQKALDDNAPKAELKAAMAKLRESRKTKADIRAKAESDLKDVLTVHQEAILLSQGVIQ